MLFLACKKSSKVRTLVYREQGLYRHLDKLAGLVVGGPAEAERFEESCEVREAGTDTGWLVGIGAEADDFAA